MECRCLPEDTAIKTNQLVSIQLHNIPYHVEFFLKIVITSAEEGGYVFGSVCLSVCPSDCSQTCERILTKFFGEVGHGSRTK